MRLSVFALGMVAIFNGNVLGRPVQIYDYERLFKEADLVVIANAIKTKETDDKEAGLGNEYVGRNTTFSIKHILQGKAEGETIDVLHFKHIRTQITINGPHLVEFVVGPEDRPILMTPSQTPQYMLFLKRRKDGRYEAVSGQVDPSLSVRKLSIPPEYEKQPASN